MRQSKFPDTQIVAILKEPMLAARSMRLGTKASAPSPPRSGGQVWWAGGGRCEAAEGVGARAAPPQADVRRAVLGESGAPRTHHKKALPLAERRALAAHFVTVTGLPVQRACRVVGRGRVTNDGPWWTGRRAMRGGSPR